MTKYSNAQAEAAVLGGIMCDTNLVMFACSECNITEDSFSLPDNRKLYVAMQEQAKQGRPVDQLTMASEGFSASRLSEIVESCTTVAHCKYYCELVRDAQIRRESVAQMTDACEALADGNTAAVDTLYNLQQELAAKCEHHAIKAERLGDFMADKMEQWEQAKGRGYVGVPSTIPGVNQYLGGYRRGIMSIIAGYRGEGKSTLVRQEALGQTIEHGQHIALYTQEDPGDIAAANIIGSIARTSILNLDVGNWRPSDMEAMREAWKQNADLPLWIISQPLTAAQICAHARLLHARNRLDMIWVDHIQYLRPYILPRHSRNDTIATYSNMFCACAKELDIPVGIVSQLGRESEKQARKPRLSDLRDSGTLEQDARQVGLLYFDKEKGHHMYEIAKNNYGASHKEVALTRMDGEQRFMAVEPEMEEFDEDDPSF